MIRAFNLSEQLRIPVIVLIDEVLGHLSEGVIPPEPGSFEIINRKMTTKKPEEFFPYDTSEGDVPPFAPYFEGYRWHTTGLNHDHTGFPTTDPAVVDFDERRMIRKVLDNRDIIDKVEWFMADDAEVGVFSFGSTARAAMVAVKQAREKGIKAGLMRPVTLWPFPKQQVYDFAKQVKAFVVAEFNLGQIVYEVERSAKYELPVHRVLKTGGVPISPAEILAGIEEVA